jgi:hypothetical protein
MRKLGVNEVLFPEQGNGDASGAWEPTFRVRPIAHNVLCVAKTRIEGAWNAYVSAVPGKRHEDEWEAVWRHGDKLDEKVALALFPEFEGVPYAY